MKKNYQEGDPITWLQVHNLLPVVGGVISLVAVFYVLSNKVDLIEQRLTFYEGKVDTAIIKQNDLEARLNEAGIGTQSMRVRGASTASGEPKTGTESGGVETVENP